MSDSDDSQNEAQFGMTGGFQFVAYTLDVALWGAAMSLVLQYFHRYAKKDPLGIRLVVGFLGLIATNHIVLYAVQNYKDLILLFGNYEAQNVIINEDNVMLGSVFLVAFTAQMFYASRIWMLTRPRWVFVAPVVFLATMQFAAGIGQTLLVAREHFFSKLLATAPVSSTQSGSALACDLTITFVLSYILRRSRTGNIRTDSVLEKMSLYAINRGAMTSLWALLQLIFFVAMPGSFVFMLFILPSCQLYVISVCGMLMSRESLLEELRGQDGIISTYDVTGAVNEENRRNFSGNSVNGAVHVTTSVVRWIDQIPEDQESGTEVNAEKDTSSSTSRQP